MTGQRVLILGATGMLGHALLRELSQAPEFDVYGSARSVGAVQRHFPDELADRIATDVDGTDIASVRRLIDRLQPHVVVNCIGVIKQHHTVGDTVTTIGLNALLPHLLARECAARNTRLIHVSTDCVFSGERGGYVEEDIPDPADFYGRSKLLGEVTGAPALTLRTSIIGHELASNRSLVDWFLSQESVVNGYTGAIYSGVTTTEFARLLCTVVLPAPELVGLFHVASTPISKYELLGLIARTYGWQGRIMAYEGLTCDRSLSADAFWAVTGYRPPEWPEMIARMRQSAVRWRLPITGAARDETLIG
jgi:dTDP-4-dehydrorhamnose reductase